MEFRQMGLCELTANGTMGIEARRHCKDDATSLPKLMNRMPLLILLAAVLSMRCECKSLEAPLKANLEQKAGDKMQITAQAASTLNEKCKPALGKSFSIADLNLTMMPIPAGTFTMGAEKVNADETPLTFVTLTQTFWIGETEVTVDQFRVFIDATSYRTEAESGDGMIVCIEGRWEKKAGFSWRSPGMNQNGRHPVVGVSWNDAVEFCKWLTKREEAEGRLPGGYEYSLPTEAQWEYACRAGTIGDYFGRLDSMGWYAENSGKKINAVAQKQPNAWGLYDMHGNVMEWCLDWYASKLPGGSVQNPRGASQGSQRILRGGAWNCPAAICRSAFRGSFAPSGCWGNLGFRISLSPMSVM